MVGPVAPVRLSKKIARKPDDDKEYFGTSFGDQEQASVPNQTGGQSKKAKSRRDRKKAQQKLILANLCGDVKKAHTTSIKRLLKKNKSLQLQDKDMTLVQDVDGGMMLLKCRNKQQAEQIYRRLQNVKLFGRRMKAKYFEATAVTCDRNPCLMNVVTSEPLTVSLVSHALSGNSGFLNVVIDPDYSEGIVETVAATHDDDDGGEEQSTAVAEPSAKRFVASFASEGSALHARAVLSGRLQLSGAAHIFIERRK